jgi:hypothetical protein
MSNWTKIGTDLDDSQSSVVSHINCEVQGRCSNSSTVYTSNADEI